MSEHKADHYMLNFYRREIEACQEKIAKYERALALIAARAMEQDNKQ